LLYVIFKVVWGAFWESMQRPDLPGYAKSAPAGQYATLKWDDLHKGVWLQDQLPSVPAVVQALSGKPVVVAGYLQPPGDGGTANEFTFMAHAPGEDDHGGGPAPGDVIFVRIARKQKLSATEYPVRVFGTFQVATGKVKGVELYAINEAVLTLH
jgi:hypothetical protein